MGSNNIVEVNVGEVRVGDLLDIDGEVWRVDSIQNDNNGYGVWVTNTVSGSGRWVFSLTVCRIVAAIDNNKSGKKSVTYVGAIDYDGVEHYMADVYFVTREMWMKWLEDDKPEMIGSILANNVTGPGWYYLAGSTYDEGYDVWRSAAKPILKQGEFIGHSIRELDVLSDVKFLVLYDDCPIFVTQVADKIIRAELVKALSAGRYQVPACANGDSVVLSYKFNSVEQQVAIMQKDSANPANEFEFECWDDAVLRHVR